MRRSKSEGGDKVIEMYDTVAEEYTNAFFNRETLEAELHYMEKFLCNVEPAGKILDAGCGPGIETGLITGKGFKYVGIDLSRKMIEIARRENPHALFRVMDMRDLEFSDDHFDGVMALESLIHFSKARLPPILLELRRVLKPGGILLVALQEGTGQRLIPFPFDKRKRILLTGFSETEVKQLLMSLGFKAIYSTAREALPREFTFRKLIVVCKKPLQP